MTIVLNHTIVPARDKVAAARFFANIFGLPFDAEGGHFAPVRVNDSLTFLFDDDVSFGSHHYAFHVNDAEFDSIFERIKQAGLAYGSAPWSLDDGKLNDWNGGRGDYFKDPNGHILELNKGPSSPRSHLTYNVEKAREALIAHDRAAVGGALHRTGCSVPTCRKR